MTTVTAERIRSKKNNSICDRLLVRPNFYINDSNYYRISHKYSSKGKHLLQTIVHIFIDCNAHHSYEEEVLFTANGISEDGMATMIQL